jgi:ADP-ribose pyrophosphatase YjhB (NUDIX family)
MPTTHLLARAIIRRKDRVLVVRADGQSHTFLPGGHVEAGEGLAGCLRRELREELGVAATVGPYRGVVEHRWRRDGAPQYELNHCFAVEAPSLTANTAPDACEGYLTFGWVPLDAEALAEADLQPAPLRRLLGKGAPGGASWWASTLDSATPIDGASGSNR